MTRASDRETDDRRADASGDGSGSRGDALDVGLVVYGGLDRTSGGFRYDRKLVSHLEGRGDRVEVIALPWRTYPEHLADARSEALRAKLNRPVDVLVQDELCHPSLWRHNPHLDRPGAVVSIVHHLRTDEVGPTLRPATRAIERRYLRTVDAAICASADTRDRTVALAPLPTLVARPGGRVEGAAVSPEAAAGRAREGPLRIGFVGNLVPRKGATTLLAGLARVDRPWELTVVGSHEADPGYAREVREAAAERGIGERVTFAGEVDDAELASLLRRLHVLAVPSRHEGFGAVYLEAMEYGAVPVASAAGGASELVADGENGFLVEPDDPDRIAAVVDRLAADRTELARLSRAALETASEHPGWAETMERARSFLVDIAGGREPGTDGRDGGDHA
ncbi:glycosyltransferase family 4 protein [Salinilacihabitans rarus]|uniref:glycosyltransferase family 4 protein n=1 Tax=Salinilacihabitans rarus TaxID=2961596 RepID=UPI0020C926BE|nr:glycosyltransferase family 4 protein [Salinilacihabitans rarus]